MSHWPRTRANWHPGEGATSGAQVPSANGEAAAGYGYSVGKRAAVNAQALRRFHSDSPANLREPSRFGGRSFGHAEDALVVHCSV